MKIRSAKFIRGITGTSDILYDGKFQVAFLGRSNVGKSTLINTLCQKSELARSSSHPGKTIRMDFFLINNLFYFVDFPGYGYASRSQDNRDKLAKMILWYLVYSEVPQRMVFLIIDAKVGITAFDKDMLRILSEQQIDHFIIANKIDNLPMSQKTQQLKHIQQESGGIEIIPFSSVKKHGRDDVLLKVTPYLPPLM